MSEEQPPRNGSGDDASSSRGSFGGEGGSGNRAPGRRGAEARGSGAGSSGRSWGQQGTDRGGRRQSEADDRRGRDQGPGRAGGSGARSRSGGPARSGSGLRSERSRPGSGDGEQGRRGPYRSAETDPRRRDASRRDYEDRGARPDRDAPRSAGPRRDGGPARDR